MNILIGVISFKLLTGAEIYTYELSRELCKRGHKVVVVSPSVGGLIAKKAKEAGVEVHNIKESIDFKPDIIHAMEFYPAQILLARYPKVPAVATVHSEYPMEKPLVSDRIHKYICIRESIIDRVNDWYGIPKEKCIHIPNGFDLERFNTNYTPVKNERPVILFVGSIDKLRRNAIENLIENSNKNGWRVQFVGMRIEGYLDGYEHWIQPSVDDGGVWHTEDYVKKCDMTASILLGRTTIEGWLCGKNGIIYDLDDSADIKSIKCHPPPANIKETYDIKNMTNRVLKIYDETMESV